MKKEKVNKNLRPTKSTVKTDTVENTNEITPIMMVAKLAGTAEWASWKMLSA